MYANVVMHKNTPMILMINADCLHDINFLVECCCYDIFMFREKNNKLFIL